MQVYEAGRNNFRKLVSEGIFVQDKQDSLYIYELIMDGRSQNGIVACASVDDYMQGHIKKHELTRPDKEADRKNHVRVSMMNAEPVFFAYPANKTLDDIIASIKQSKPVYSFTATRWFLSAKEKSTGKNSFLLQKRVVLKIISLR